MNNHRFKTIDIGHSNHSIDQAISILETAVSEAIYTGKIRVIKVITGHGSGSIKRAVRTWCGEQEGRFNAVIYGENYSLFDKDSAEMRSECEVNHDRDFGQGNSAITYIWLF
tara:strand:+ start:539 stop:874 length:336 start_codon:yes stop_codon:yes gene_type:complete